MLTASLKAARVCSGPMLWWTICLAVMRMSSAFYLAGMLYCVDLQCAWHWPAKHCMRVQVFMRKHTLFGMHAAGCVAFRCRYTSAQLPAHQTPDTRDRAEIHLCWMQAHVPASGPAVSGRRVQAVRWCEGWP